MKPTVPQTRVAANPRAVEPAALVQSEMIACGSVNPPDVERDELPECVRERVEEVGDAKREAGDSSQHLSGPQRIGRVSQQALRQRARNRRDRREDSNLREAEAAVTQEQRGECDAERDGAEIQKEVGAERDDLAVLEAMGVS